MIRTIRHGVTIECVQGDIANQPGVDAVVNAANAELQIGKGVAGAIHKAAGPGLVHECRPLAPIAPGQAVITSGHHLPNRYVIHCLGPVYGRDEPAGELLAACHRNALELAEKTRLNSIAFPAISTGAFGFPLEPAAKIAVSAIFKEISHLSSLSYIRLVLFDPFDLEVYTRLVKAAPECAQEN